MDDDLRLKLRKARIDQRLIDNAAFLDGQAGYLGHNLAFAGSEIVDHEYLVALRQPVFDQVGAKAAGAAGNQDTHRTLAYLLPSRRRCVYSPSVPCFW
jgi:hypothetical protein